MTRTPAPSTPVPSVRKIPATVVTGFLGAGKTTLIRHMLENANGKRIALIINEFGDIGVDGDVLKSCGDETCNQDDIVELANGCICCTVADDFIPVMKNLISRDNIPDHIVIETSGLALPQPLVKAFSWPQISAAVTVDGVITVVDGPALAAGRFAHDHHAVDEQRKADPELDHESPLHELFEDQLNCADMVIINKADLLSEHDLEHISQDLKKEIRKGATLIPAQHGKIDIEVLLGMDSGAENDLNTRKSHHEQHGHEDHDHDDFVTFAVTLPEITDKNALIAQLEQTIQAHNILRLKGFVAIKSNPSRLVVQAVGPRINAYFDRPWSPDEAPSTNLVVIGLKGLDEAVITSELTG